MNILRARGPPVFLYYLPGAGLRPARLPSGGGGQFSEDAQSCSLRSRGSGRLLRPAGRRGPLTLRSDEGHQRGQRR